MTTLEADDALLMAYVDGELSPEQSEAIEQLMNASPAVAERVAQLIASDVPYSDAFARQAVPPVPDSLMRNVDALIAQHQAGATPSFTSPVAPEAAHVNPVAEDESLLTRLFGRPKLGWLAVAFATGAACYGLVIQAGIVGTTLNTDSTLAGATVAAVQPSAWVRQAASYQQLYSPDTLIYVKPDYDGMRKTIDDIRHVDGLALRVPDLSAAGLTFRRVQRLRFNDRALIQLVYVPENGAPVALCVMKELAPDQSVAQLSVSGMSVAVWRQSELGYALIGAPNGVDLAAVARLVADRSSPQLFSARAPSPVWVADIRQ